jgi:hypothetical protein
LVLAIPFKYFLLKILPNESFYRKKDHSMAAHYYQHTGCGIYLRTAKKYTAGRHHFEMGIVSAGGNVGFMDVEGAFGT